MGAELAISLAGVSKAYRLYAQPLDRLKEALHPLHKQYHQSFYALRNIDLQVKKGEVLGIVGVNGAGKSTLLKIIAGVLQADSGQIQIDGTVNALLELGAALKPELTGRQNIRFNLQVSGAGQVCDQLMDEVVGFADLGQHLDQPVKTYSSGMKARLGFAIATASEPDILIVDEVLAVGDILFQRKCYKKIDSLRQQGKTIIFVSHSAQTLIEFCSRAVLLYERRIILDADPKTVTDYYQRLVLGKNEQQVLQEIRQYVVDRSGSGQQPAEVALHRMQTKPQAQPAKLAHALFLPGLKSTPQNEYQFAAEVLNVQLLNKAGERVNLLTTGERYEYRYRVRFGEDFAQVSFGMHVKTLKGMGLASSAMHFDNRCIAQVQQGDEYVVRWQFDCHLLAGIYLTNAGVFVENGTRMSRVVDAIIFRVQPADCSRSGLVDLGQKVEFTRVERT